MAAAAYPCPVCRNALTWVPQYNAWYCYACKQYRQPAQAAAPAGAAPAPVASNVAQVQVPNLWNQNTYRIRRKVLAIAQQYFIEDQQGNQIGYSKQKMFKLKEDIRVFANEQMAHELFRIQQTNWSDAWGQFAIIDSASGQAVGHVRRKALASLIRSEWEMYNAASQLVGGIYEKTGRALARRFVPMGALIPTKLEVTLQGQIVATIDQQFKIIGDKWDINAQWLPPAVDRRVLISSAILMGMIERAQGK
jgi:uncharacterized protein YxjI